MRNMNKNFGVLVCLLILFSCKKSDDDSNVVDNVVDNSEIMQKPY